MNKYLAVFTIAWQNEFTYRLNFILWRLRNIFRFLTAYFLWSGVFVTNQQVFGYSHSQMLTYVFSVLIVSSFILSAPSSDNIGSEIASGDLSNYLVKPISYIKYWFSRDLSSKLLNLIFAAAEILLLWLIFKPIIQLPTELAQVLGFTLSLLLATLTYYFFSLAVRFISFWAPENTWPVAFLTLVLIEILAGGLFPLDVLPPKAQTILQFTPFPYFLYYPVAIFVGKIQGLELLRILLQSLVWMGVMFWAVKFVWGKGLKVYAAEGR